MSSRASADNRRAFTLLEVIVATMIVGMLALTLHRFLSTHLSAMRGASDLRDERSSLQAVVNLLETQLRDLPPKAEAGRLEGRPYQFHGLSNDEITWRCAAGPGLLTAAANGEFQATLTVQPVDERSSETELGLRRRPVNSQTEGDVELTRGGGGRKYNWLPLVRPMAALEIRYYDASANTWNETWTNPGRYPDLVRVRLWRRADDLPVEAILPVPSARVSP